VNCGTLQSREKLKTAACVAACVRLECRLVSRAVDWSAVSDLERRDERREPRRSVEDSNSGPYVLIALALAFAGFGASIGISTGLLIPVFVFMFPALVLLALGISKLQEKKQRTIPPKLNKERELLSAIRDNGGSITPAEAAMETSLTVREADGMLSELAGSGHLAVESREGSLFYALPRRHGPQIEGEG
jgi:hypothetical protein